MSGFTSTDRNWHESEMEVCGLFGFQQVAVWVPTLIQYNRAEVQRPHSLHVVNSVSFPLVRVYQQVEHYDAYGAEKSSWSIV